MNDRKTVGGKHVSRSRMVSYSYSFDPEEAELANMTDDTKDAICLFIGALGLVIATLVEQGLL